MRKTIVNLKFGKHPNTSLQSNKVIQDIEYTMLNLSTDSEPTILKNLKNHFESNTYFCWNHLNETL